MVVGDADFVGIAVFPDEADAPLIVDTNAVLSPPVAAEGFKMIAWWGAQIVKIH